MLSLLRGAVIGGLVLPIGPTLFPVLGWLISPLHGDRYVPVVMDLYPNIAIEIGYLSDDGIVYQVWGWLQH